MKAYLIEIPSESLINSAMERIDYQDAFAIDVPLASDALPEKMPILFFKVFPSWFRGLMYLREFIARRIGLKTAHGMDVEQHLNNFTGEVGEAIALFKVMGKNETELLMGENDKHLDFRLSFFAIPKGQSTHMILATTVQFNGWLGKLYFLPVGPIHRLIVPIVLKRMARRFLKEGETALMMS